MMYRAVLAVFVLVQASFARHHHHVHAHPQDLEKMSGLEEQDKFIVVDTKTGIAYNPYSKHHPGRHVCTSTKDSVKTKQSYCKPTYKKFQQKCNENQICTAVRLVYERVYLPAVKPAKTQPTYVCCPGWKQISQRSHGCNKPICASGCLNGGNCTKPEVCSCARGFAGKFCELDVDECKEEKPCDQVCVNTPGSFRCSCRDKFLLGEDGQSCIPQHSDPGIEAKELQFESLDSLDQRIHNLETILENGNNMKIDNHIKEMESDLNNINQEVKSLIFKIKDVDLYKFEMNQFRQKLSQMERKSTKIDELAAKYEKIKKCAFYNKICI